MPLDDPQPHTEYNGRMHRAEIRFYVPVEVTEEQVREWLDFELGSGFLPEGNPLNETLINDLRIEDCRAENAWSYTDWGSRQEDGSRRGQRRIEFQPQEGGRG